MAQVNIENWSTSAGVWRRLERTLLLYRESPVTGYVLATATQVLSDRSIT